MRAIFANVHRASIRINALAFVDVQNDMLAAENELNAHNNRLVREMGIYQASAAGELQRYDTATETHVTLLRNQPPMPEVGQQRGPIEQWWHRRAEIAAFQEERMPKRKELQAALQNLNAYDLLKDRDERHRIEESLKYWYKHLVIQDPDKAWQRIYFSCAIVFGIPVVLGVAAACYAGMSMVTACYTAAAIEASINVVSRHNHNYLPAIISQSVETAVTYIYAACAEAEMSYIDKTLKYWYARPTELMQDRAKQCRYFSCTVVALSAPGVLGAIAASVAGAPVVPALCTAVAVVTGVSLMSRYDHLPATIANPLNMAMRYVDSVLYDEKAYISQ